MRKKKEVTEGEEPAQEGEDEIDESFQWMSNKILVGV